MEYKSVASVSPGASVVSGDGLDIRGLRKSYGSVKALDDVSLNVSAGEFITLLGPSGSGKTTLLMVIMGLVRPEGGQVIMKGQDIVRIPPHRRGIGVVFQNYALFPHMSVAENISYPLRVRGVPKAEIATALAQVLGLVKLVGYDDRRIDQLSGGQRQRVALARALVFRPGILLLDEPLSALDRNLREEMQFELRRLHHSVGSTMIMVTHDQDEALALSDRVAVMNGGVIEQVGAPREIYDLPRSAFVAGFIGQPHLLPVTVSDGRARWHNTEVNADTSVVGNGPALLVLRPDRITLAGAAVPEDATLFAGQVRDIAYRGDFVAVFLALSDDTEITARVPVTMHDPELVPGSQVRIALRRRDAILVPQP